MLTRIRARLASAPRDAGMTLMELVVTMSLMTVVGAMALAWFIGSTTTTTNTTDSTLTSADARVAMQSFVGLLQVAHTPAAGSGQSRVTALTANSISFDANLGYLPACQDGSACPVGSVSHVTLAMRPATGSNGASANQLVETISGSSTLVEVANGVGQVAGSQCLFTAYDSSGTSLGCAGVTLANIVRVGIAFTVTPASGQAQTFQSGVTLPASAA